MTHSLTSFHEFGPSSSVCFVIVRDSPFSVFVRSFS